jgi:hypothetical protein
MFERLKKRVVVKEPVSQKDVIKYIDVLCSKYEDANQTEIIKAMSGSMGVKAVEEYAHLLKPVELLRLSLKDMQYYEEQMLKLATGWPSYGKRESSFPLSNYTKSANRAHKQIELIKTAIKMFEDAQCLK